MDEILAARAQAYERHQPRIGPSLGSGHHAALMLLCATKTLPALKVHKEREPYQRERRAYEILATHRVSQIHGFNVPQFLGSDDELLVIEMSIVERPFLLDFAGAYVDPPEFSDEIWTHWLDQKKEQFEDRWPIVQRVLSTLKTYELHMVDVTPTNIAFREDDIPP